ncbi:hypothetical protein TDB9533_03220 [Thalassocella blandensis]|nr:hypothetical protein TDB9533_03220 [Thalassocella blandensis]
MDKILFCLGQKHDGEQKIQQWYALFFALNLCDLNKNLLIRIIRNKFLPNISRLNLCREKIFMNVTVKNIH